MERRVIVIAGPTASGKTSLGIALAKKLGSEIISADSRQFYRMLDIGTAKPTRDELASVKHHFVDSHEITDKYNVSKFEKDALKVIAALHSANVVPVVVGGSGLYVRAIVDGIVADAETDEEYRAELLELRKTKGDDYLYGLLVRKDPVGASMMLPQNWKRVMRALEVIHVTGKPIWKLQEEYKRKDNLIFHQFALDWQREVLYERIERRVEKMIETGLIEEVKKIIASGFSPEINALNTVGYKEIFSYLNGEITFERAVELIKRNTRRYAKRQLTWFRKDKRITWIPVNEESDFDEIAVRIIDEINKGEK